MKRVAILQSNYIPWKGYFDLINYVDEFVIYDDMQYTAIVTGKLCEIPVPIKLL